MREYVAAALVCFLVIAQLPLGLTFKPTFPAFLWSPHEDGTGVKEAVDYQTLSPKELAKSVMTKGGWSNLLCSGIQDEKALDLALVFVGKELQSSNIAKQSDPSYMDFIKVPFLNANHSLAYPYIATSEEEETMETSLISEFEESCGLKFGAGKVALLESCSIEGDKYEKLADLNALNEYLVSRMENKQKGQTDLVVLCPESSDSERNIFSNLVNSVEQTGARYSVLYVSDPIRSKLYPTYRDLGRLLAESTAGNGSLNSTACDGVCSVKSSLLEGLLVGIVLLIILISGLCCMAGIDTPTKFEAPLES